MDTPPNDENATPSVPPVPPPPPAPGTFAPPIPPVPPAPGSGPPRIALGDAGATAVPAAPAAPAKPLWKRIPTKFLVIGVIVAGIAIVGFISSRGKTNAEDLAVGDCFQSQSTGSFSDVEDQSCDGLHDTEIYAIVAMPAGTQWPGADILVDSSGALAGCENALNDLDALGRLNIENLPVDWQFSTITADRDGWDDGDRDVLCVGISTLGFPGPIVATE